MNIAMMSQSMHDDAWRKHVKNDISMESHFAAELDYQGWVEAYDRASEMPKSDNYSTWVEYLHFDYKYDDEAAAKKIVRETVCASIGHQNVWDEMIDSNRCSTCGLGDWSETLLPF